MNSLRLLSLTAFAGCLLSACGVPSSSSYEEKLTQQPAGAWVVDLENSTLQFTGQQNGQPFTGTFEKFDAVIILDLADLAAASIVVEVDMSSAKTGDREKDQALPSADWFDAKNHPKAVFSSSQITAMPNGTYKAEGTLRIRDVEQPLTLPFTLDITDGQASAQGDVTLLRSAFGVGQGEFASDEWIAFEVGVAFEIEASK